MGDLTQFQRSLAVEITDTSADSPAKINTALPGSSDAALTVREAAQGQQTMANSAPVVIASNQSNLPINVVQINGSTVSTAATGIIKVGISDSSGSSITLGQTTMASSIPVAIASNQSSIPVAGDVASGSSDSGNPVKIGAVGHTANPSAVADGQRVNLIADKIGRLVVTPYHVRDLKVQQRTSISSTTETTVVTAVASTFLDLTQIIITNTNTKNDVQVDFRDSTAGTIRVTIWSPAAATVTVNFADILQQSTVNNNWTATSSGTSQLYITVLAVKNI